MSHKLLQRFQGGNGFYNAFPTPFTELFFQQSFDGGVYEILATIYPVIEFEFVSDYEKRKRAEKVVSKMQPQSPKAYPVISQWRYSRKFDFVGESQLSAELSPDDTSPEQIQSGRALFEYSCAELDTLELDRKQCHILEGNESNVLHNPHLLVVDPLWVIFFPKSSKFLYCSISPWAMI